MNQPPPPPPPPNPAPAAAKKGLSPLAWIAIGCAGIALIGVIAVGALGIFAVKKGQEFVEQVDGDPVRAAAEMVVRLNPEIELVDGESAPGTLTIREKSTGKTATLDLSDIKEGRISFDSDDGESLQFDARGGEDGGLTITSEDGEMRFGGDVGDLPEWLLLPDGAHDLQMAMSSSTSKGDGGSVILTVDGPPDAQAQAYKEALIASGWEVRHEQSTTGTDGQVVIFSCEDPNTERYIQATALREGELTRMTLIYGGAG